jgi:hypothetical protein
MRPSVTLSTSVIAHSRRPFARSPTRQSRSAWVSPAGYEWRGRALLDDEAQRKERQRASRKKYNASHPDRVQQGRRQNLARRRARLAADRSRRTRDRVRVREWAAAYPERARERSTTWAEENPDRRRELQRNYYHRHEEERRRATRDQNARRRQDPAQREREREDQAARRQSRNAQQRIRRSDPAAHKKSNREQNERRRRERRRHQLGLPPRRPHHSTINEREANDAAAHSFFSHRREPAAIRQLRQEHAEIQAATVLASEEFWRTQLDTQIRTDATKPARVAAAVNDILATHAGSRLREEIRMDAIALRLRGAPSYPDAEAEARRRALASLTARGTARTEAGLPAGSGARKLAQLGSKHRTSVVRPDRGRSSI